MGSCGLFDGLTSVMEPVTKDATTSNQSIRKLKETLFRIDLPDDESNDDALTTSVRGLLDLSWACNSRKELLDAVEKWICVEELPEVEELINKSTTRESEDVSSLE